jgi:hypothetical protein
MIARALAALAAGTLFGFGLAVAQMTDPRKVLGFLDITGAWDPSLLVVIAVAVPVTFAGYRLAGRRRAPLLDSRFGLPTLTRIDVPLLAGATLFGIGWGIAGYCPGPALATIAAPTRETLIFVPTLFAGFGLARIWALRRSRG